MELEEVSKPNEGASPLILIAGLGADERQWAPQLAAFTGSVAPPWIDFDPGESLPAFARRFGAGLPIGPQTVLAGSSFGGMVALEVARQHPIKPACVVLIGSCRDRAPINPALLLVERIARLLPDAIIDRCRWMGLPFLGRGEGISRADRRLIRTMGREAPVRFLRHASRAISTWGGCPDPGVPVQHINGDRDWVLFPGVARADELVPGGAHVLNLSRVERVNAFLARCLVEARAGAFIERDAAR